MAGHQIDLLHILCLKGALQDTVNSSKFKELKVVKVIVYALMRDEIWRYLFVMCQDMYAPMRVIFLADHKTPAMEKLFYFFSRQIACFRNGSRMQTITVIIY